MPDWRGRTATSDTGWTHLERLVDLGSRMAGSEGEHEAARLTRDALAEHAREARLSAFPVQGWVRGESRLRTPGPTQDCIALPRSPAGETEGRLVDLGHGLPEGFAEADLEGAVVMTRSDVPGWYDRYLHRREKYYHAVEAGAAAFVYRNHVEGCLPPTGSVGTEDAPIGAIPAVGVSAEVGARLARRFDGQRVGVEVECSTPEATSHNVHAELGPDTDEALLVTSHVDAHDIAEGALDNGAGTATLVEVARGLAEREADLDTRVQLLVFGAEEVGLVGSTVAAERLDLADVRAVLNLDGVVRGRDLTFTSHRFDALAAAIERVADRLGHPAAVSPKVAPHSDHWPFVARGVAGTHVMSETGAEGRGWGHTAADTLDKLDRRDLREQALFLTELAVELAAADHPSETVDQSTLEGYLEADDLLEGMTVTGDWPP